ncbi:MAG: hypothetical protein JW776_07870 [Candidatus Lokiarchaeota archaeon]|nr:hypothetical protein [Candidatus Lokiarchaeota archaeon]
MSRRFDLLRLGYTFSVLIPCLLAIYLHDLVLWRYIDIIMGFFLYAITGNTLNDMIDVRNPEETDTIERINGFTWREILTISILSFIFGTMLFIRAIIENWINGIILGIIIVCVIVYCLEKHIPIINQILLGISHVFLPYLIIKIDSGLTPVVSSQEWFLMITFFAFAFTGQVVHEAIDGDAITRFSLKIQQIIVILSSLITIGVGIITVIVLDDIYFIPFCLIPIGSIYVFRKPERPKSGVKDVGIILGNIILLYFLVLIIRNLLVA